MDYKVYILISESSGRYYIGQTQNLQDRLLKHNNGYVKSTKSRGPWKVYFSINVESRSEAIKLERKLKNLRSRIRLEAYVKNHKR